MTKFPILISACCVTLYWVTVVVKSFMIARKIGKDPNVLPREPIGQFSRLIWIPTIILWIILLWQGVLKPSVTLFSLPSFIKTCSAWVVIITTVLTFWCWREMGRSWRIGIDPNEKTKLIFTGPYRYVLHPIYSLSMILSVATFFTLPTAPILVIIVIHLTMLKGEARREEKHLLRIHGDLYRHYQQRVGRFVPCFTEQRTKA